MSVRPCFNYDSFTNKEEMKPHHWAYKTNRQKLFISPCDRFLFPCFTLCSRSRVSSGREGEMWECGETMDSLWQKTEEGHRPTRKSHLTQSMSQLTEQTVFLIVLRTCVSSWLSVTGHERWWWISRAIFDLVAPDCVGQLEMRRATSSQEDVANIYLFTFLVRPACFSPVTQTKMDDMSAVGRILQKWRQSICDFARVTSFTERVTERHRSRCPLATSHTDDRLIVIVDSRWANDVGDVKESRMLQSLKAKYP